MAPALALLPAPAAAPPVVNERPVKAEVGLAFRAPRWTLPRCWAKGERPPAIATARARGAPNGVAPPSRVSRRPVDVYDFSLSVAVAAEPITLDRRRASARCGACRTTDRNVIYFTDLPLRIHLCTGIPPI
jgi:hypothetical protein